MTRSQATVRLVFPTRYKRTPWTAHEIETLLLHVDLFGPQWTLISESMGRSYGSLASKYSIEKRRRKHEPHEPRYPEKSMMSKAVVATGTLNLSSSSSKRALIWSSSSSKWPEW